VNARFYYTVRIAMFAVIFLMVPAMMLWTRAKPDPIVTTGLIVFDLIIAGLLLHAVRRFKSLEPGAQINNGPPPEVVRAHAEAGSRQMPLASFAIGAVSLVGSWFYMMYEHRGYPVILLIAPPLFLLGLAGTIHPPIFYAMRNDVGEVDGGHRAIAYFLLIVGLAIGGFCAWWLFWS
jgi:hypothetical protein